MIAPILFSALALFGNNAAAYPPSQPIWGQTITGAAAVLWYDAGRLYNSNPYDSLYALSHWDDIAWQGDWLVYTGTYAVAPLAPKWITFTPGIRYLPRTGDAKWFGWSRFASESGVGVVRYLGEMRGSVLTIREWMYWDSGWITEWAERYEFGTIGGVPSLIHTVGGNATGADSWDITFTRVGS